MARSVYPRRTYGPCSLTGSKMKRSYLHLLPAPGRPAEHLGYKSARTIVQVNNTSTAISAQARGEGMPLRPASGTADSTHQGHVFISYVREDSAEVEGLQQMLEAAGIPVWRDKASLWPGEDWRARIRDAITLTRWCSSPASPATALRAGRAI